MVVTIIPSASIVESMETRLKGADSNLENQRCSTIQVMSSDNMQSYLQNLSHLMPEFYHVNVCYHYICMFYVYDFIFT